MVIPLSQLSLIVAVASLTVSIFPKLLRWYIHRYYDTGISITVAPEDYILDITSPENPEVIRWSNLRSGPMRLVSRFAYEPSYEGYSNTPLYKYPTFSISHPVDNEIHVEHTTLTTDQRWRLRKDLTKSYESQGDTTRGTLFLTDSFILGPESGVERPIPFEPQPGRCTITLIVHGKIPAEQLGLPGFLDDFRIKPVEGKLAVEVNEEDIEKG